MVSFGVSPLVSGCLRVCSTTRQEASGSLRSVNMTGDETEVWTAGQWCRHRLAETRREQGLTVSGLADRCARVGAAHITTNVLWNIESGRRTISLDIVLALSAALDVTPLSLMLPQSSDTPVSITSLIRPSAGTVAAWISGIKPLPTGQDARAPRTPPPAPAATVSSDLASRLQWLAATGKDPSVSHDAVLQFLTELAADDNPRTRHILSELRDRLGLDDDSTQEP